MLHDVQLADRVDETWIRQVLKNLGVQLRGDDVGEELPPERNATVWQDLLVSTLAPPLGIKKGYFVGGFSGFWLLMRCLCSL